MTVDDDIERRAELWATGATIHNVKNLLGWRRSCVSALKQLRHDDARRRYFEETLVCADKTIEQYMGHGNYLKARDDNPLPTSPPRPERGI